MTLCLENNIIAQPPFFFLTIPPPPRSTLFPYTTLFRSRTRDDTSRSRCRPPSMADDGGSVRVRSEEHTSELQSRFDLVCRLLLEKKKLNATLIFFSSFRHVLFFNVIDVVYVAK